MKKLNDIRVRTSTFVCVTFFSGLFMILVASGFSLDTYAMDPDAAPAPAAETTVIPQKKEATPAPEAKNPLKAQKKRFRQFLLRRKQALLQQKTKRKKLILFHPNPKQ